MNWTICYSSGQWMLWVFFFRLPVIFLVTGQFNSECIWKSILLRNMRLLEITLRLLSTCLSLSRYQFYLSLALLLLLLHHFTYHFIIIIIIIIIIISSSSSSSSITIILTILITIIINDSMISYQCGLVIRTFFFCLFSSH